MRTWIDAFMDAPVGTDAAILAARLVTEEAGKRGLSAPLITSLDDGGLMLDWDSADGISPSLAVGPDGVTFTAYFPGSIDDPEGCTFGVDELDAAFFDRWPEAG